MVMPVAPILAKGPNWLSIAGLAVIAAPIPNELKVKNAETTKPTTDKNLAHLLIS